MRWQSSCTRRECVPACSPTRSVGALPTSRRATGRAAYVQVRPAQPDFVILRRYCRYQGMGGGLTMEGDANSTKAVRRYGFVIDTTMCFGCQACVLACKVENNVSDGIRWNNLLTDGGDSPNTPGGTYPDTLHRLYYPVACQHCENPACVKVCPVGATYKDPETAPCARTTTSASAAVCACRHARTRACVRSTGKSRSIRSTTRSEERASPSTRSTLWRSALCATTVLRAGKSLPASMHARPTRAIGGILTIPSPRCRSFLHRGRTNSCSSTGKRSLRCIPHLGRKGRYHV